MILTELLYIICFSGQTMVISFVGHFSGDFFFFLRLDMPSLYYLLVVYQALIPKIEKPSKDLSIGGY